MDHIVLNIASEVPEPTLFPIFHVNFWLHLFSLEDHGRVDDSVICNRRSLQDR